MDNLTDPNLLTRPPEEPVPLQMQGTVLGDMYSRMARMNDGARHADLRLIVERLLESWDLAEVDRIARTYAKSERIENIAPLTAAELIGIQNPGAHREDILAFAKSVAFDADEYAIARGIEAAPRLRSQIAFVRNNDEASNLLGFLFQTTAATTRLIHLMLENTDEPPAPFTRRWPKSGGDVIVVSLADKALRFGAGPHQCPGRNIAETIASAAVDELRRAANA